MQCVSSEWYSDCIFETKSRWKRCCDWELDEVGYLSSCNWCISLFVEFALGKTGAEVDGARCERTGNVRGRVGGALRDAGGNGSVSVVGSPEGVAEIRGRMSMLARC